MNRDQGADINLTSNLHVLAMQVFFIRLDRLKILLLVNIDC